MYSWRRQERIDQGVEAGLTSGERAELMAARRRIRELEAVGVWHRPAIQEYAEGLRLPNEEKPHLSPEDGR